MAEEDVKQKRNLGHSYTCIPRDSQGGPSQPQWFSPLFPSFPGNPKRRRILPGTSLQDSENSHVGGRGESSGCCQGREPPTYLIFQCFNPLSCPGEEKPGNIQLCPPPSHHHHSLPSVQGNDYRSSPGCESIPILWQPTSSGTREPGNDLAPTSGCHVQTWHPPPPPPPAFPGCHLDMESCGSVGMQPLIPAGKQLCLESLN